jgi:hypothetical protein
MEFREVFDDNVALARFLRALKMFEKKFCEGMAEGLDSTYRLEIRCCKRRLGKIRVQEDTHDHAPDGDKDMADQDLD